MTQAAWFLVTIGLRFTGEAVAQDPVRVVGGSVAAHAVLGGTWVDRTPLGGSRVEVRVEQPRLMLGGHLFRGRLVGRATIDLEGLTLEDGVLTVGAWGEGFIDRRHPHTYAHELILSVPDFLGRLDGAGALSLSAGKGFAPFGSDDPMTRPVLRFPVNHHWSHILERAVIILGVRQGPVTFEGGLFNGDEPERPGQWPLLDRFGDSWSARLTVAPSSPVELSASHARVKSPEHRPGAATDHVKWHLSARLTQGAGDGQLTSLAEWARTAEAGGLYVFYSVLGEAEWNSPRYRAYYRFERTDRPEEERTLDPFRSQRPHLENTILGRTRWTIHTAGYGVPLQLFRRRVRIEPLIEGSYARVQRVGGGIFEVGTFYRDLRVWSVTLAVRLGVGPGHRMGRYGVWQSHQAGH